MAEINERNAVEVANEVKARAAGGTSPSTVRKSLSISALAKALAKAQGEMKNPPKDSVNPHFKSRYADLATVRDTVLPVLSKNGLAVVQLPCELDGEAALTTILMHDSGEYVETTIKLRGKSDPQGVGSALTYARRYALQAVAGVAADEDDDGNAASRPHQQHQKQASLADQCIGAFEQCNSRESMAPVYHQFEADRKAGKFTDAEVERIETTVKRVAAKFPKPAPKT